MPAIDKEADEKPSWADLVEEGEADHIPPPTEVINGDTKIVTEFKRNEEGKLLKIVRTFKIETKRVSKTIAKRKLWRKFGDAKNDGPGPNPSTTTVTDDVFLILTTNKEDLQQDNDDPLKKLGQSSQKIVQCRICKGDHWTTKCPYKDQLEVIQAQVKDDEAKSAVDAGGAVGGAGEQPQASKTGKYIAPSLREGAGNRRGETMPRSQRDETATIRVTNLSEDTRESDLMELFPRDIAQLLAMSFQTLEVETKLLSNPREGTSIQAILAQLRQQLNDAEECFVCTDSSHAISFKVRRWTPALTKIEDESAVPVPLLDLQKLLDPERRSESPAGRDFQQALPFSLDPALAAVLPLIDGVRSVQTIANDSPLRSDYVVMILRHLLHFDLIHLIPGIGLDNRYRLTPAYHTVLEDLEKGEEAVQYVTAGHWNGKDLAEEERYKVIQRAMALYAFLACEGKQLERFKQEQSEELAALGISLRHFVTWGLLQGYLERVEDNVGSLNKEQADELFRLRTEDIPNRKKYLKEQGLSGRQVNQDEKVKEMVERMQMLRNAEA